MRSPVLGPVPCITLISMLAAAAVATLILVLDGTAEYGLAAGVILLSVFIHFRDRRIIERERERERLQGIRAAAAILRGDAEAQSAPEPELPGSQQRPDA